MAILKIARLGHPILRRVAEPVPVEEINGPETQALIRDLIQTMREYDGAGLAAPQVNVPIRLFVIDSEQIFENQDEDEKGEYPDGNRRDLISEGGRFCA